MTQEPTLPTPTKQPDKPVHILIVEDEPPLLHLLASSLRRVGYEPLCAYTGQQALERFNKFHQTHGRDVDLVLTDIVLPGMDGHELCAALREISHVPVIMLTALSRPDDIVRGFDIGADDYIIKPFIFREVEVRVEAVLRRMQWQEQPPEFSHLYGNGLHLDVENCTVSVRGEQIELTPIENRLLAELMRHPNHTLDKSRLFRNVWGYQGREGKNVVEVAMRRLRLKIEQDVTDPQILVTVPNFGYKFSAPSTDSEELPTSPNASPHR